MNIQKVVLKEVGPFEDVTISFNGLTQILCVGKKALADDLRRVVLETFDFVYSLREKNTNYMMWRTKRSSSMAVEFTGYFHGKHRDMRVLVEFNAENRPLYSFSVKEWGEDGCYYCGYDITEYTNGPRVELEDYIYEHFVTNAGEAFCKMDRLPKYAVKMMGIEDDVVDCAETVHWLCAASDATEGDVLIAIRPYRDDRRETLMDIFRDNDRKPDGTWRKDIIIILDDYDDVDLREPVTVIKDGRSQSTGYTWEEDDNKRREIIKQRLEKIL